MGARAAFHDDYMAATDHAPEGFLLKAPREDEWNAELRRNRGAALVKHQPEVWKASPCTGLYQCAKCVWLQRQGGAVKCRLQGKNYSGHGPVVDAFGVSAALTPRRHTAEQVRVKLEGANGYEGAVTGFSKLTGKHTVTTLAGELPVWLSFVTKRLVVTGS
jgi:hypothetical protein